MSQELLFYVLLHFNNYNLIMEEGKPIIKILPERTAAITQYNLLVPEGAAGSSINQAQSLMIAGDLNVLLSSPMGLKERYKLVRIS